MATFRIGETQVTRAEDFTDRGVPLSLLLPEATAEQIARHRGALEPAFLNADDTIDVSIHSWLIRTKHHNILVDTCVGHQKKRHFPPFNLRDSVYLENLKAVGLHPDEIDYVFCTHLHSDHVGWNMRSENDRWVPTFPKARYLFSRKDYDALDPRQANWPHYGGTDENTFLDSVLPVIEAGQVEFVDGEHRVGDGLTIIPAPGHSPGPLRVARRGRGDERIVHRRLPASSDAGV